MFPSATAFYIFLRQAPAPSLGTCHDPALFQRPGHIPILSVLFHLSFAFVAHV
jgi:hypothetical protein